MAKCGQKKFFVVYSFSISPLLLVQVEQKGVSFPSTLWFSKAGVVKDNYKRIKLFVWSFMILPGQFGLDAMLPNQQYKPQ